MNTPVFWLKRAFLATRQRIDETIAPYHLSSGQYDVLLHLWNQDGMEQRQLQNCLGITSATLTGLIDGLTERGLVERRPHPEDARVKAIFLTPEGHALYAEQHQAAEAFHTKFLEGFSRSEAALLQDWLRRIALNMGDTSEECG